MDGTKIDVEASRTYVEVCDTCPAAVFAQARPRHRIADVALRAATEKWGRDGGGTVTITSLSSSPAWRFEKGRTGSDQVVSRGSGSEFAGLEFWGDGSGLRLGVWGSMIVQSSG